AIPLPSCLTLCRSFASSVRIKERIVISRALLAGLVVLLVSDSCQAAEAAMADAEPAIAFAVPPDAQALDSVAPELARQAIKALTPKVRNQDLMGAYQLEMVAGDYSAAEATLDAI